MSLSSISTEDSVEALCAEYLLPNYGRFPIAFTHGRGTWLWDEGGRDYLDFGSGIAVNTLGHASPVMQQALKEQAAQLIHCSNLYLNRPQAELARFLVETVMKQAGKVFFCNSGTEANEALIKLARRFGQLSPGSDGGPRHEIITFRNSFHGRTLGAMAATGQDRIKQGFEPGLPGFVHVPYNDPAALAEAVTPGTVAILLEVIQGEGGIAVAHPEFLNAVQRLCQEHDLLLLFDEVQCGLGRVGDWCAWKRLLGDAGLPEDSLIPDAVSWAKGLGGGFPIGSLWVGDREVPGEGASQLCDVLGPGTHGCTFGGTPLASAVALAVMEEVERLELGEAARRHEEVIRSAVAEWESPWIGELRGRGLMLGFVLDEARFRERCEPCRSGARTPSVHLVTKLMESGLLTVPAGPGVVRWLPPLNVKPDEIELALQRQLTVLQTLDSDCS